MKGWTVRGALVATAAVVAIAAVLALTPAPATPASEGATLPSGFVERQFAAGFTRPYTMRFAPDGRLFVAQQGGKLRVVKDGVLLDRPFAQLRVDSSGDRGLIGIAFDPAFATNGYVYIYYTAPAPAPHNRVSRLTARGDVAVAGSERVLLELDDLGKSRIHNGGNLEFRPDGMLYVTTGENVQRTVSQSMSSTHGKVLRINPDGTIPTDNPFYGTTTGVYRAIWALGMRNPFTGAVQPGTGRYFINDVGAKAWEEIDEAVAGANYGWSESEGPTTDPRFVGPLFAYGHGPPLESPTNGCAIVGGAFYNPTVQQFPPSSTGAYFFADSCSGWIRQLDTVNGNRVSGFATDVESPVDLEVGPDGSLYYLARPHEGSGSVYRVSYAANDPERGPTRKTPGPALVVGAAALLGVGAFLVFRMSRRRLH
jgi:glucose/arabinose dehydrogenase